MLASKIKEIKNGRVIVKDAKTRDYVSPTQMTSAGFKLVKSETDRISGAELNWYIHPLIRNHHFLLRDDREGILVGQGSPGGGISNTVQNIPQVFNLLKHYLDSKTKDLNLLPEEVVRIVMKKAGVSKSIAERAVSKLLEGGEVSAGLSDADILKKAKPFLPINDSKAKDGRSAEEIQKEIREVSNEIDKIVLGGGRITLTDPLTIKINRLRSELRQAKGPKDAYNPTKPKNIAAAKSLSVAQGKAATGDKKTKDVSETVKTVPYKGFIITLYKDYSPRFGNMYYAKNNIGEPYLDVPRFQTPEEAINWDKKNVDQYVSEQ